MKIPEEYKCACGKKNIKLKRMGYYQYKSCPTCGIYRWRSYTINLKDKGELDKMKNENLVTAIELSNEIGITAQSLRDLCKSGVVPFHKIGCSYVFTAADVEAVKFYISNRPHRGRWGKNKNENEVEK